MTLKDDMRAMGERARAAARAMARASAEAKNAALRGAAERIGARAKDILRVNASDCEAARRNGETPAFLDRMALDERRLQAIAESLLAIAAQEDPIGETIAAWTRPNGLRIARVRAPIGVVAVIYESRPNVTVDAAAIALKAGNAAILRGGSECRATSAALFAPFAEAIAAAGLPPHAAQLVATPDRAAVGALLSGLEGAIDLIVPRGGKSLVARVAREARAPVLGHLDGLCHVYVDRDADPQKAIAITVNAKMRRPGVCGAAETLLLDRAIAPALWPDLATALREAGCALRADESLRAIDPTLDAATAKDWDTEYLAPILSVALVDGVDGALAHLERHATGHTEAIITENQTTADQFFREADSAILLHNASTQFADGGEFGLGAEIGIATGKLHARGPVGARELTTYKNIVRGEGQIRP